MFRGFQPCYGYVTTPLPRGNKSTRDRKSENPGMVGIKSAELLKYRPIIKLPVRACLPWCTGRREPGQREPSASEQESMRNCARLDDRSNVYTLLPLLLYPFILREQFSNEEIKRENFQRVSMRFDAMKFPLTRCSGPRRFQHRLLCFLATSSLGLFSHCHGQLPSIEKGNRPLESMSAVYKINSEWPRPIRFTEAKNRSGSRRPTFPSNQRERNFYRAWSFQRKSETSVEKFHGSSIRRNARTITSFSNVRGKFVTGMVPGPRCISSEVSPPMFDIFTRVVEAVERPARARERSHD